MRFLKLFVLLSFLSACTLTQPPDAPLTLEALTPVPTPSKTPENCTAINDEVLALRVAPDIIADEVTILDAGTVSEVIGRIGDNSYWQVRTTAGRVGWLDSSATNIYGSCADIPITDAPTITPATTSTPSVPTANILVNLNVRRGPGTVFSPPMGQFDEGDTAEIIGVNPSRTWYKVAWSGSEGWISGSSEFVSVSGNTSNLPVDAGPPTPIPTNTEIPATAMPTLDPNTNYLQNAGFEGLYTGRGYADMNIPEGWQVTYYEEPRNNEWQNLRPVAFPHRTPPEIRSGDLSLNLAKDYATFTAAVYQQVTVPRDIVVQASAWAWLHTCNPDPAICDSDPSSGAKVRVGIDPTGGTSALSDKIVWSDFQTPHDTWGNVGTIAQAQGGVVTMFLYMTQDIPLGLNRVYWDDARLNVGG